MPLSYSLKILIINYVAAHALLFLSSNCAIEIHKHTEQRTSLAAESWLTEKRLCAMLPLCLWCVHTAERMRWHYFPTGACLFTFLIYALAGDVIFFQSATHKASVSLPLTIFFSKPHGTLQLTECGCVMRELMCKMHRGSCRFSSRRRLSRRSNRTASFISLA
jgi:hypothetical protein